MGSVQKKDSSQHPLGEGREQFVVRFEAALHSIGCDTTPPKIARAFNLRFPDEAVSPQAVRKWMRGEASPSDSKLHALGAWLAVDPAWLRFGSSSGYPAPALTANHEDGLERDLSLLNKAERQLIRKMTDLLLEVRATRKQSIPLMSSE